MDDHSEHFVPPLRYYVGTFTALLALTVLTVFITRFDLGLFNTVVALLIAISKASLVAMFFMGLRWDKAFNGVVFVGTLLFLLIFIAFTASDIFFRFATDPVEAGVFDIQSKVKLVKTLPHSSH